MTSCLSLLDCCLTNLKQDKDRLVKLGGNLFRLYLVWSRQIDTA